MHPAVVRANTKPPVAREPTDKTSFIGSNGNIIRIVGKYLRPKQSLLYSLTLSRSKVPIFRRFCSIPTTLSATHLRVHDLEPVIMLHSLSVPISTLPCQMALRGRNNSCRTYRVFSTPAMARSSGGDCHDRFEVEYTPWLVVGLGNPGNKYQGTRHNVGFEMVDRMARAEGLLLNTIQSKALIGIGCVGEVPIVLAKPQVYMNFIGESVSPLATYYGVPLRHVIVVYDEMGLPNGVMRLQPKGGDGKHNGLKSVMAHLDQRKDVPRLSIGIGSPPGSMDMKAFLLQKFSLAERAQIDEALDQGVEALRTLVLTGFSQSISRFNVSQKYKYNKV